MNWVSGAGGANMVAENDETRSEGLVRFQENAAGHRLLLCRRRGHGRLFHALRCQQGGEPNRGCSARAKARCENGAKIEDFSSESSCFSCGLLRDSKGVCLALGFLFCGSKIRLEMMRRTLRTFPNRRTILSIDWTFLWSPGFSNGGFNSRPKTKGSIDSKGICRMNQKLTCFLS